MRSIVLPVLLLAAALGACSGGPGDPAALPEGRFEGRWDGSPWRGRAYAVLVADTLYVVGHRPDPKYDYDEYVQARVPFSGPGAYSVPARAGRLSKITGGDAGYFPDAAGTLAVHAYDARRGTVAGEVVLSAESVRPAWRAEGRFHARVYSSFRDVPPPPRR